MRKSLKPIFYEEREKKDREIREALCASVQHIEASDHMKQQIDRRISGELIKEEIMRKHFSMKKVIISVAAACLVIGTVCIAGSGIKYYMGGSSVYPDYTEFSDLAKAEETVGYDVKAVENFDNGFRFQSITIGDTSLVDESGKEQESQKELQLRYEKDGEEITLFMRRLYQEEAGRLDETEKERLERCEQVLQAGAVQAGFLRLINKFVPVDYELTEEDEKNMENPNFNLAYGSSEVEENIGYSTSWIDNGVLYDLYGTDLSITGDEMLEMAKEIIESKQ